MKFITVFILLGIQCCLVCLFAQDAEVERPDSLFLSPDTIVVPEFQSGNGMVTQVKIDTIFAAAEMKSEFKPDPKKAAIYAAICPGLGQIYNRKYWKLPLVYGGFLGCAYAITWNGEQYNGYKQAYNDLQTNPETGKPNGVSWINYLGYRNPETMTKSDWNQFSSQLKKSRDYYRRYRDMSYIITVGVYALCIIDAYVDAQMFDFDISPDLSMRVEPVLFERSEFNKNSVGLQCSFSF